MPRRQPRYEEKPWKPDPVKWAKVLEPAKDTPKQGTPVKPKDGWQLWRLDTLEDVDQTENSLRC